MYQIWRQSVKQFDSFPRHFNLWTPQTAPWGIVGRLVFSLCPFPDESADVNQSWCQSVQPFDSFSRLLNVWPPKTPKCPRVSKGNLFDVYPFPDESAHVCQIRCQSVQPFDSFNILLNLWPPKTHKMPPVILRGELYLAHVESFPSQDFWICDPLKPPGVLRGGLCLAYVHCQTNPQICTKFSANRSSRLTASQNIWICDPLTPPPPPEMPLGYCGANCI